MNSGRSMGVGHGAPGVQGSRPEMGTHPASAGAATQRCGPGSEQIVQLDPPITQQKFMWTIVDLHTWSCDESRTCDHARQKTGMPGESCTQGAAHQNCGGRPFWSRPVPVCSVPIEPAWLMRNCCACPRLSSAAPSTALPGRLTRRLVVEATHAKTVHSRGMMGHSTPPLWLGAECCVGTDYGFACRGSCTVLTHVQPLLHQPHLQPQEPVHLPHPLAVAPSQVVIHRHHVHPLPCTHHADARHLAVPRPHLPCHARKPLCGNCTLTKGSA